MPWPPRTANPAASVWAVMLQQVGFAPPCACTNQSRNPMSILLNRRQVATELAISERSVRRLVKNGALPAPLRIGAPRGGARPMWPTMCGGCPKPRRGDLPTSRAAVEGATMAKVEILPTHDPRRICTAAELSCAPKPSQAEVYCDRRLLQDPYQDARLSGNAPCQGGSTASGIEVAG